jgi:peptidoglycan/xylan/chitin deacetylase (PgdA/CDA1 family)
LWRCSNPALEADVREQLVAELMTARRELKAATGVGRTTLKERISEAKIALGERGPVWWSDAAPDYNRHMVGNSPYRDWYAGLG